MRADKIVNFVKPDNELLTDMDKWLYLLKHMNTLDKVPTFLDKRVFQLIFNVSEVAKLRKEERMAYEASLKNKWDTQNAFDAVRREARVEGAEQKSYKVVANLIQQLGLNDEAAAGVAEVSVDFVRKVRADLLKKK
ncbi:MAG TPA: PD-(D/E)XK nuclease family transposase [Parapedobacter sp.]|nr:PD-(D/E)XK nuclease family transposase [Parapedobacter sp.]